MDLLLESQDAVGTPLWATAAIAVAAALLGAAVGGYTTYRASVALDKRAREARAAIRRKAKIYGPLRAEIVLLLGMLEDEDLIREINTPRTDAYGRYRDSADRPGFYVWEEMLEDSRGLSASASIRGVMVRAQKEIDRFNSALSDSVERLNPVFRDAARAAGLEIHESASVDHTLSQVLTRAEGIWLHLGAPDKSIADTATREQRLEQQRQEIQRRLTASKEAEDARRVIRERRENVVAALRKAKSQLEETMRSIARKYEMETTED